jgi:three-Cys-motif partner protein
MHPYLEPEDDGLTMRPAGSWAADKLDYLARYINVFETSMRNKWTVRYYIDLLSGPGKNRVRESGEVLLGSPLIALTTQHPFTHYIFVDNSPENTAALRERCSVSPYSDRVTILTGDCNTLVDQIVAQIQPVQWQSLNLAFLDPEGMELQWSTVEKLARLPRMDLIINYPQGGLKRGMRQVFEANPPTKVDRFFGGSRVARDIREVPAKAPPRRPALSPAGPIQKQPGETGLPVTYIGIVDTGDSPLIRNVQRRAPLYRLLFASKHPLGNEFWEKITRREPSGQRRLL